MKTRPRTPELVIHIDGASRGNPGPASAGVEIKGPDGVVVKTISERIGTATNNTAEYFALIFALEEAAVLGAEKISVFTDSELLARQFNGQYKVKDPSIRLFTVQVKRLKRYFKECRVAHVPREENAPADALANAALDQELF